MLIKEFGGLPWNLLFKERPEFASGNKVLNCRLEGEGLEYYLAIDDVKIDSQLSTWRQPITSKDYVTIYSITPEKISIYLERHKVNLLPYWFNKQYEYSKFKDKHDKSLNCNGNCEDCSGCYSDYVKDSIGILSSFLHDDCNSNEEQHRTIVENYKALLLEKIPEKEEDEFFSFFISQKVLKKVDEEHYTLHLGVTPGNFRFLSSEAFSHGYISYELKYTELQALIYINENEKKLYGLNTWKKGKEAISEESGRWKPKFLIEIFNKERG